MGAVVLNEYKKKKINKIDGRYYTRNCNKRAAEKIKSEQRVFSLLWHKLDG